MIIVAVILWITSRIIYFTTAYFTVKPTKAFICELEILQNIPVFLMYFCFIVVQRVILKSYVVMEKKEIAKRQR